MIAAGIGCRRLCPADRIVVLVRQAVASLGRPVEALAAPAFKRGEPGLLEAAAILGLPLHFVEQAGLAAVQALCPTRSEAALRAFGVASVAEGAALAVGGPPLLLVRFGGDGATCAVAGGA